MKSRIDVKDGKAVKFCRNMDEFEKELRIYNLQLDITPVLYFVGKSMSLELELIDGECLSSEISFDFSKIAEIYAKLHRATIQGEKVICHLDNNPRNYLIRATDGRYFAIDFAESDYSFPETDLVNFLLFWAPYYSPVDFRHKFESFLTAYAAKELLNRDRKKYREHLVEVFDERRRRYCKKPAVNEVWQVKNRKTIIEELYDVVL